MNALLQRSALDQASLIRNGKISAEELTRACIARIEEREPSVHAFVQQTYDGALATARALDRQRSKEGTAKWSALAGVPTAMKDLHFMKGTFTRCGSRAFRYLWTPFDDISTKAVRDAQLPLLGKVSTSELAILPIIHPDIHAPTRNPWDLSRYSGGSSGGSGAAIAAGMFSIGVASDGGGSIRIPASFNGLVGHKATRGAVPNPFAMFERLSLSVIGPHARTIPDAAALLDVLTGFENAPHSYSAQLQAPQPRLRIRFTTENPVVTTAPHIKASVEYAAKLLESLGHQVQEGSIVRGSVDEFLPMFQFLAAGMTVTSEKVLQPSTKWIRAEGRKVTLEQAMKARESFRERIDKGFADVDLWLTPTVAIDPPRVGEFEGLSGEQVFRKAAVLGAFTGALNASGNPATSIPFHPAKHGIEAPTPVPVGLQVVAPRGQDLRCLRVAQELLEALGTPQVPMPN